MSNILHKIMFSLRAVDFNNNLFRPLSLSRSLSLYLLIKVLIEMLFPKAYRSACGPFHSKRRGCSPEPLRILSLKLLQKPANEINENRTGINK